MTTKTVWGRVWLFGDDIDTDALAPGAYIKQPIAELAAHCLETVDRAFAPGVIDGDIIVAGRNFGMGSSREQAAEALTVLGIAAVLAESFAGIFYRNALNLGLPALVLPADQRTGIVAGERVRLDPATGVLTMRRGNKTRQCQPIPPDLLAMVRAGGLVPHLENRLKGVAP